MAKLARSYVDVVLGEAVSGTRGQRYADMKAIVSAIENRARALGVTPEDVISAKDQFDAYGKSLPKGVERFRELAEQAIADVQVNGPTHTGMFYATPSAMKNLPSGLQPVDKTAGHMFFDDPQNRSIATAVGYITPDKTALSAPQPAAQGFFGSMAQPLSNAVDAIGGLLGNLSGRPQGMEALAPNGLIDPTAGNLTYDLSGAKRNQVPTSGIGLKVHEVANDVIPGIDTSLYSGMEPAGRAPVGAANRHPLGFAGDFMFSKAGQQITDPVALQDVAMGMAAKYGANIGYSAAPKGTPGAYMGPGRMHIDTMPLDQYPGGAQWGQTARSWADNLNFARETGIGPTPYSNAPTPASRTGALAEIAEAAKQAEARQSMGSSMAQAGVTGLSGTLGASPARPDNFATPDRMVGSPAPTPPSPLRPDNMAYGGPKGTFNVNTPAPVSAVASLSPPSSASISPTPISASSVAPVSTTALKPTTVTPSAVRPTFAPPAPPPQPIAPVQPQRVTAPVSRPTSVASAAPPTPSFSAMDVWSGAAPAGAVGMASNGAKVSRDQYGNTTIENQYGAKTTFDASGRMVSTADSKIGGMVAERAPGILGSMLGTAIAGPVGGLLGNLAGRSVAGQRPGGLLGALFGGGSMGGGRGSSSGSTSGGRSSSGRSAGSDRDHAGF